MLPACHCTAYRQLRSVQYAVDCGTPTIINNSLIVSYNSTLEGSTLLFSCKNGLIPDNEVIAVCHKNASWTPSPVDHNCGIITSSGRYYDTVHE